MGGIPPARGGARDDVPVPLRVALLGCGRLGCEVMLPLLARRRDVRVTVVAEPDPAAQARARALAPGARIESDWRAALAAPDLDAAVVTVPTALHSAVALAGVDRGLALYLEKPLAATAEEATAIRHAWQATRPTLAVGFNARFHPLMAAMRRHVREGRIGEPRLLRCAFTVAARPIGSWRHHEAGGGGVLRDLASHHVDLAAFLLDHPLLAVTATRQTPADGGETVAATGEFEGGAVMSATWASGTVDSDAVDVIGTDGAVSVSRYDDLAPVCRGRETPGRMVRLRRAVPTMASLDFGWSKRQSPWHDPSFAAALGHFFEAARRRAVVVPGVEEGWRSACVVAAISESAATGRRVSLPPEVGRRGA